MYPPGFAVYITLDLMNRYRRSFLFAGIVVSLPCAFLLALNLYFFPVGGIALCAAFQLLWWGLYWALKREKKHAFVASFVVIVLFWLPLLYQTVRRLAFGIENDSLEGPDGEGSPLAFLLGLFMEQLFFIPLSIVLASALIGLAKRELSFRSATS